MGKRKQRKHKEVQKSEQQPSKNQENMQNTANYTTPPKGEGNPLNEHETCNKNVPLIQFNQPKYQNKNGGPIQANPKQQDNQGGLMSVQVNNGPKEGVGQLQSPASQTFSQLQKGQNDRMYKCSQKDLDQCKVNSEKAQPLKCYSNQKPSGLTAMNNQAHPTNRDQMFNQIQITSQQCQEMDSSIEEDFNIGEEMEYGMEDFDEQGIQFTQEGALNAFGEDYYDEVESYEEVVSHLNPSRVPNLNLQMLSNKKNLLVHNLLNSKLLLKKQFPQVVDIKRDESFLQDLSHCLFCIYNNKDLDLYFKQLLRIQKVLRDGRHYIIPQQVADVLVQNVKEFIKGIRIRLVQEMKSCGLLSKMKISRRYSYDDFFLLDNSFNKNFAIAASGLNEFIGTGIHYLMGDQYERVRDIARQNMMRRAKANKFKIPHFQYSPEAYKKIFDMIIRYYTKVRDQVIKLEEMWVFLMETVYSQELKGQMIFEQIHKQLFDNEVLKTQYIVEFLSEIKNSYSLHFSKRDASKPLSKVEEILSNLYQTLQDLEEEIAFQYNEAVDDNVRKESVETNDQTDPDPVDPTAFEEQQEEYQYISTYEQLKEKSREKQGGLTLAETISLFEQSDNQISHKEILSRIKQKQKNAELMNKLPELDTETICYIIENKITPKDCEKILKDTQVRYQDQDETDEEAYLISPAKDSKGKTHRNYSCSQEEDKDNERELEKKKKKNKKKKRRRKEKKIIAQQQLQLDHLWYESLKEELKHREINQQFQQYMNQMTKEEQLQIKSFLRESKLNRQSLSHRDHISIQNNNPFQGDIIEAEMASLAKTQEEEQINDQEFEEQLKQFKEKLEMISKEATQRKRKLVPNVSRMWLDQLQSTLAGQFSFNSPRNANSLIVETKELWLQQHQNSA